MPLVRMNWQPDRGTLRRFSQFGLVFFGLFFGPLALANDQRTLFYAFSAAGVVVWLIGLVRPEILRLPYVMLSVITFPIGWVVAHGLLAVAFFGVLTPIGMAFRLLGRERLSRRFDPTQKTYWEPHRSARELARYLKQF